MGEKREVELVDLSGASSLSQFRRKARAWVEAHADDLTLVRLRKGKPITNSDLGELQVFNDALAEFTLSANQIAFVELIVEQLTASERLDPALLYEPPFTDRNPNGVSDLSRMIRLGSSWRLSEGLSPHWRPDNLNRHFLGRAPRASTDTL